MVTTAWLCVCCCLIAVIQRCCSSVCGLGPCRCARGMLTCDCTANNVQEVELEDLGRESLSHISVKNCSKVRVAGGAIGEVRALQTITLSHIAHLTLEERSFSWASDDPHHPGLLVNISESVTEQLPSYCFQGALREVLLTDVRVNRINAYAFSAIDHAERLSLQRLHVKHFDQQAFKKCAVDVLTVSDSVFNVLPSRTMVSVEVHREVKLSGVVINTIKYLALKIHGPKSFALVDSRIGRVEHRALHIHTRGPVLIHNNEFQQVERTAFMGLTVERRYTQQDLVFSNNTVGEADCAMLEFNHTALRPRVSRLLVRQQCACWLQLDPAQVYCLQSDSHSPVSLQQYWQQHCLAPGSQTPFVLVLVAASLAASAIAALVYWLRRRRARYTTVPHSPSPLKVQEPGVVVPDGRLYRETELHVIVEQVMPLYGTAELVKA